MDCCASYSTGSQKMKKTPKIHYAQIRDSGMFFSQFSGLHTQISEVQSCKAKLQGREQILSAGRGAVALAFGRPALTGGGSGGPIFQNLMNTFLRSSLKNGPPLTGR